MLAIIKTEFQKIKRYHIILIGIIGMFCSPLTQLFSQAVMSEEVKRPDFAFADLVEMTIWGNAQIFMPVIFTLIGGYLMNREYTDDTLKNILTVPVSFRKFLTGKLIAVGLLAVVLGVYSFVVTVIVSVCANLHGISVSVMISGLLQMIGLSVWIYIVVLPIIGICSKKPGWFMGGALIAFITGYCILFFKKGLLRNIYPFSAALTMIGFDTADYSGTSGKGSIPLAIVSLSGMFMAAALIIFLSKTPGEVKTKRKRKEVSLRPAQRGRGRINGC